MASTLETHMVTRLLLDWQGGREAALGELLPLVHAELRRRAELFMRRERPGRTLQATALINEAYMRLVESERVGAASRSEFLAVCANLMRQVLVDAARARSARKRGGGEVRVEFEEGLVISSEREAQVVALDDALRSLERLSPRQARVVELRYFGGLTVEETAVALKISPETVMRDWKVAKVWLLRELRNQT